jgi:hypothetical protein
MATPKAAVPLVTGITLSTGALLKTITLLGDTVPLRFLAFHKA